MTKNNPVIVGAGLTGLIAAHAWPQSPLFEAAPAPTQSHKALLRFRTPSVSHLTGIEFKEVTVRKGIWYDGAFQMPNIKMANEYAIKTRGIAGLSAGDRSIWNIDTAKRFIAPEDFYDRLLDRVDSRIKFDTQFDYAGQSYVPNNEVPVISTAPMQVPLSSLGLKYPVVFEKQKIVVKRYRIDAANLHQTIYYPQDNTALYRASITGSMLIAEFCCEPAVPGHSESILSESFGIPLKEFEMIDVVEQKFGKIAPIPEANRKRILFDLTHIANVYSLGRFAIWKNILLDDVVQDITVIKRLMEGGSAYDVKKAQSQ